MERERYTHPQFGYCAAAQGLAGQRQVYNIKDAAAAFGVSRDVLNRAINAGDLVTLDPRVDGRALSIRLIAADELWRWLRNEERA